MTLPQSAGSLANMRMAVNQHVQGVTGDQHSPWTRAANTPGEMVGVARRWADSVGQTRTAWADIGAPVGKGTPNQRPPTTGEKAARVIRATQQTVGAITGALGMAKDMLDVGFANLTAPLAAIFPSLPAATVASPYLGTPHAHMHPPSFVPPAPPVPLPSIGMVLLGVNVRTLINCMPAARAGDIGPAPTCCAIPPAWFEIKTGSSNVFIGGARAARLLDICRCCVPKVPGAALVAGKVMAAVGTVASVASTAVAAAGVVGGALGIAADVAEAAVEDDAAMASAKALSAAMASAQMAMDASKMAVEAMMGKDPGVPPSTGAIIDPSHANVLIGGFPMINIPDPVNAILNRLKRYKPKPPAAEADGVGCPNCPQGRR